MFQTKNFDDAKKFFKLSLKYGKLDTLVYFYIRDCYVKLGSEQKAIEYENYGVMLDKDFEFGDLYIFGC